MAAIAYGVIQSITIGGQAMSFLSMVGTDVVINTLMNTTSAVGALTMQLLTSDSITLSGFKQKMDEIDLEYTVNVLNELVNEYSNKELNNSSKTALIGVTETLKRIHNELLKIKQQVDAEQKQWFVWRRADYRSNLTVIEQQNLILYKRYSLFIELLKIQN